MMKILSAQGPKIMVRAKREEITMLCAAWSIT
jgi:hypothetical protein